MKFGRIVKDRDWTGTWYWCYVYPDEEEEE